MARKGEMINEFLSLLNPMIMEDEDKVLLYLFQSSSVRDGRRFSMSKPETIMARLAWRNLDRVDEAVAALEVQGRARRGRSVSPFDNSKVVDGFFVSTGPASPEQPAAALETTQASPAAGEGLFGIARYGDGEDDGTGRKACDVEIPCQPAPDPIRVQAERAVTESFRESVSLELCDLIAARPFLRHPGYREETALLNLERLRDLYVKYAGEVKWNGPKIQKLIATDLLADWMGRYEAHRSNAAA